MHEFVHDAWHATQLTLASEWLKPEAGPDCCGPMPVEATPSSVPIAYEAFSL